MTLTAWLASGETLGDRVMKVDHAGEHGAIYIDRARSRRWCCGMQEQIAELDGVATQAVTVLRDIVQEEQAHHDPSEAHVGRGRSGRRYSVRSSPLPPRR